MRGCTNNTAGRRTSGGDGQGRYCSHQLAGSGPNRTCSYRRNSWPAPLRSIPSLVSGFFRYLRYLIGREVGKLRMSGGGPLDVDTRSSGAALSDSETRRQPRLESPGAEQSSTDVKK